MKPFGYMPKNGITGLFFSFERNSALIFTGVHQFAYQLGANKYLFSSVLMLAYAIICVFIFNYFDWEKL